jgi:sugar O-acyltransferase (sialic acid O-acetyltransferase NeuD family)
MANRKLIIVGDSSFAEVAYEYFTAEGRYEVVSFAVNRDYLKKTELMGRPVTALEDIADEFPPDAHDAFVAITYGEMNRVRQRLVEETSEKGYRIASYVSPDAHVWPNVEVGRNTFIFENNVVQPFVTLGENVILWSGNHIGHHSRIEDNVFISSHVVVSGHCSIGRNSFMGVNSTVADQINVAAYNWIGPNVLISKDTAEGELYRAAPDSPSKVDSFRFFKIHR